MNRKVSPYVNIEKDRVVFRNSIVLVFNGILEMIVVIGVLSAKSLREIFEKGGFAAVAKNIEKVRGYAFSDISVAFITVAVLFIISILLTVRFFFIWKNSTLTVDVNSISSRKWGLFFKKDSKARLEKIANVNLSAGMFYNMLGIKKVSVDLDTSYKADKEDYVIYLKKSDAFFLRNLITDIRETGSIEKSLTGLKIEAADSVDNMEKRDLERKDVHNGEKIDDAEYEKIFTLKDTVLHVFLLDFPGIIVSFIVFSVCLYFGKRFIAFVIIFPQLMGFLKNINKNYNFTLSKKGDSIHVRYGLFNTENFTIDRKNIIATGTEKSVIARILGYKYITVDVVGFGNDSDEVPYISLYMKDGDAEQYEKEVLGSAENKETDTDIMKNREKSIEKEVVGTSGICEEAVFSKKPEILLTYYFVKSVICFMAVFSIIALLFSRLWILAAGLLLGILTAFYIYSNKEIAVMENRIVVRAGIFSKNSRSISYRKIENITFSQSFIQKKMGVASLRMDIKNTKIEKSVEETGLFKEEIFYKIMEYYRNGEKQVCSKK